MAKRERDWWLQPDFFWAEIRDIVKAATGDDLPKKSPPEEFPFWVDIDKVECWIAKVATEKAREMLRGKKES